MAEITQNSPENQVFVQAAETDHLGTSGSDRFILQAISSGGPLSILDGGDGYDVLDASAVFAGSGWFFITDTELNGQKGLQLGSYFATNFEEVYGNATQSNWFLAQYIEHAQTLHGGASEDVFVGSFGPIGNWTPDKFFGYGGDDSFDVRPLDQAYGGAGNDRFELIANSGDLSGSLADGGEGQDTVVLSFGWVANLTLKYADSPFSGSLDRYHLESIENVQVYAWRGYLSRVYGDDGPNNLSVVQMFNDGSIGVYFDGAGNDDNLSGSLGNDTLIGGPGSDTLEGGDGWDLARFEFDAHEASILVRQDGSLVVSAGNDQDLISSVEELEFSNGSISNFGIAQISGDLRQGSTLAAEAIYNDATGSGSDFHYAWFVDDIFLPQITTNSLILEQDHVGKRVAVQISYLHQLGAEISLSAVTDYSISNINDEPLGEITIAVILAQNEILTAVTSDLSDPDGIGALGYQWFAAGELIIGATASSYKLTQAEVGKSVSVTVSYIDGGNALEEKASSATAPIANVNDLPLGEVSIVGNLLQGATLIADTSHLRDPDGLGALNYQWYSDGTAIPDSRNSTMTLSQNEVGKSIVVEIEYVDGGQSSETVRSAASETVTNVNDAPLGTVAVEGTWLSGDILTANVSSIEDLDGLGSGLVLAS